MNNIKKLMQKHNLFLENNVSTNTNKILKVPRKKNQIKPQPISVFFFKKKKVSGVEKKARKRREKKIFEWEYVYADVSCFHSMNPLSFVVEEVLIREQREKEFFFL